MEKKPNLFQLINGRLRLFFNFCPKCNSDAPEMYECKVCRWNYEPRHNWWKRFINN